MLAVVWNPVWPPCWRCAPPSPRDFSIKTVLKEIKSFANQKLIEGSLNPLRSATEQGRTGQGGEHLRWWPPRSTNTGQNTDATYALLFVTSQGSTSYFGFVYIPGLTVSERKKIRHPPKLRKFQAKFKWIHFKKNWQNFLVTYL
jgi:hypothetical protein